MKFEELDISPEIKLSLQEMGFSEATEVQQKAIPFALKGNDLLVRSQTGTGKTAAFGIALVDSALRGKKSIVLAPTRELAIQIFNDLRNISKNSKVKVRVVYGGESIDKQIRFLKSGYDIVIATPGRLIDHYKRGTINFDSFEIIVLDEADRMLDMGFIEDIQFIMDSMKNLKQFMLFSATLNREILGIIEPYTPSPKVIKVGEEEKPPDIEEERITINGPVKFKTLISILKSENLKTIIFLATRKSVEDLGFRLKQRGFKSDFIHGGLKQHKRERIMNSFKKGLFDILIATDVAARGLHIEGVDMVINYHQAGDEKTHLHRIGRTGRMGRKGKVITFVDGRKN